MKKKKHVKQRKKRITYKSWITAGILISSLTMLSSLSVYMGPAIIEKAALTAQNISLRISQAAEAHAKDGTDGSAGAEEAPAETAPQPSIPYLESSSELGQVEELDMAAGPEREDAAYSVMLDTSIGPMLYYNQADSRWGNYLYGGQDPMKKYGCGPTAVAMIINSFSPAPITPVTAADWAAANGCYAPQGGSYHNLITDALSSHGIPVESVKQRTADNASSLLDNGHILIALMGKGALTDNGHFILITERLDNGNVRIADPNSYENSTKEWNLEQLMSELKQSYDSGAPLWAVSLPKEG